MSRVPSRRRGGSSSSSSSSSGGGGGGGMLRTAQSRKRAFGQPLRLLFPLAFRLLLCERLRALFFELRDERDTRRRR
jgi:hypothetical protein